MSRRVIMHGSVCEMTRFFGPSFQKMGFGVATQIANLAIPVIGVVKALLRSDYDREDARAVSAIDHQRMLEEQRLRDEREREAQIAAQNAQEEREQERADAEARRALEELHLASERTQEAEERERAFRNRERETERMRRERDEAQTRLEAATRQAREEQHLRQQQQLQAEARRREERLRKEFESRERDRQEQDVRRREEERAERELEKVVLQAELARLAEERELERQNAAQALAALRADLEATIPQDLDDLNAHQEEAHKRRLQFMSAHVEAAGDQTQNRIAIVGNMGTGKSSVLCALLASNAAKIGTDEVTQGISAVGQFGNSVVFDVQGFNDNFTSYNPPLLAFLTTPKVVIVVFIEGVSEVDKICETVAVTRANVIFVRNKVDNLRDIDQSEEEFKATLEQVAIADKAKLAKYSKLRSAEYYQVSARNVRYNQKNGGKEKTYDWNDFKMKLLHHCSHE